MNRTRLVTAAGLALAAWLLWPRKARAADAVAPTPLHEPAGNPDHVVRAGDTLTDISTLLWGDWRLWPALWDANLDQVSNPNVISPGMRLRVPDLPEDIEPILDRAGSWARFPVS